MKIEDLDKEQVYNWSDDYASGRLWFNQIMDSWQVDQFSDPSWGFERVNYSIFVDKSSDIQNYTILNYDKGEILYERPTTFRN